MNGLLKNIQIPLYNVIVTVLIHEDCQKAIDMSNNIKRVDSGKTDWNEGAAWYFYWDRPTIHAIILSKYCGINEISHECLHATMTILRSKDIKYCSKTEEVFAYLQGYLTEEVWKLKQKYDKSNG